MELNTWLAYPPVNFSVKLKRPVSSLGGYVLGIPNDKRSAIAASLSAGISRGLGWLYPSPACKHGTGPHRGSCTYATLPRYWEALIDVIEKLNLQ